MRLTKGMIGVLASLALSIGSEEPLFLVVPGSVRRRNQLKLLKRYRYVIEGHPIQGTDRWTSFRLSPRGAGALDRAYLLKAPLL